MTAEQKIANLFQMKDEVWARHANPWSGLTQFPILPLIIVSIWSRTWIRWQFYNNLLGINKSYKRE